MKSYCSVSVLDLRFQSHLCVIIVMLIAIVLCCDEYILDFNCAEGCYCSSLLQLFKTVLMMELIRARRVTLLICILYKPENSVILLSANLGLERGWIRRKTKDYLLHRALRRQIFQQKSKIMQCNVWTFLSVL